MGSIPANAGKPHRPPTAVLRPGVYPRERGEAARWYNARLVGQGLSPRTRGSPLRPRRRQDPRGSIPANAGKPVSHEASSLGGGVYPRERGEALGGGNRSHCGGGLSPRTRGSLTSRRRLVPQSGSIPANAGKPRRGSWPATPSRVYPRERGEAEVPPSACAASEGLSPRTRGSRAGGGGGSSGGGSIPANAGKPARWIRRVSRERVYPRERGEAA